MHEKYSADTVICIRKKVCRTVLFKLTYSSYSDLETVNFVLLLWDYSKYEYDVQENLLPLDLFSGIFKNQSKTCINLNVSISVNNERKLTSNMTKS